MAETQSLNCVALEWGPIFPHSHTQLVPTYLILSLRLPVALPYLAQSARGIRVLLRAGTFRECLPGGSCPGLRRVLGCMAMAQGATLTPNLPSSASTMAPTGGSFDLSFWLCPADLAPALLLGELGLETLTETE